MQIYFHGFGSTRALSGYCLEVAEKIDIAAIRQALIAAVYNQDKYSGLDEILVATAFASEERILNENDIVEKDITINLLPPVCGG